MPKQSLNIGFVSTRLAGTDGVSLEVDKWYEVLKRMGHQCFCFCGKTDWKNDEAYVVEEAHFDHPEIAEVNQTLFQQKTRTEELTRSIDRLKKHLRGHLKSFVSQYDIDVIISENAWSLPMNLPLGLALAEYIADCGLPAIAHHHDFWWDRQRYLGAPAADYLKAGFPATLDRIQHVVINSVDLRQLSYREGVSPVLIPNVMDFEHPPSEADDYVSDMREKLGISGNTKFLLQPTRVVPRKEIELSIELIKYLKHPAKLVVSHKAGDEGMEYLKYLKQYASLLEVDVLFASDHFSQHRSKKQQDGKVYSLKDAYQCCDLVTYPSRLEGFGNAFLETIYYKQPLMIQNYEIFKLDIKPKGFEVVTIDDFIRPEVVRQVDELLENPEKAGSSVDKNYQLGREYYSFSRLQQRLALLLDQALNKSMIY